MEEHDIKTNNVEDDSVANNLDTLT